MSGVGKIGQFVQRLEALATPRVRRQLSQKLGGEIIRLIDEGIERGVDPYDQAWPRRTDGALPLQGLKGTFTASFDEGRVRVASNKWYSKVHQAGWTISAQSACYLRFKLPNGGWARKASVKIPQRMLIPATDLGLGERWTQRLMTVTERFMRDHMQGRG